MIRSLSDYACSPSLDDRVFVDSEAGALPRSLWPILAQLGISKGPPAGGQGKKPSLESSQAGHAGGIEPATLRPIGYHQMSGMAFASTDKGLWMPECDHLTLL